MIIRASPARWKYNEIGKLGMSSARTGSKAAYSSIVCGIKYCNDIFGLQPKPCIRLNQSFTSSDT